MVDGNEYWKDKRIFVTGATGFLGSWITKRLVDLGSNVTVLIRDDVFISNFYMLGLQKHVNIISGKLEQYKLLHRALNEYEIDTCLHVAAQPIVGVALRTPRTTFETNIRGTWNILEAARNCETVKRVVVASSDKAYGDHDNLPYDEDVALKGKYPYDVSKACADLLARAYFHTYGLPVGVTRCGNLYGPGDMNFSRIVPGTFKSIIKNENPTIRSDGTFKRDYFFIQDAVDAYLTLAQNLDRKEIHGQAFNFAPQRPMTVLELFNKMIEISGKTHLKPVILNQAKSEIKDQFLSREKATALLGWSPKFSVEDGLKITHPWYVDLLAGRLAVKK